MFTMCRLVVLVILGLWHAVLALFMLGFDANNKNNNSIQPQIAQGSFY
jgi:hypothetical protein